MRMCLTYENHPTSIRMSRRIFNVIRSCAFGVTAVLSTVLFLLYAKSRTTNNDLTKSNIRLEVELEASKARERDLPTVVKALSADMIKEQSESFKITTTDPMGMMMENLRTRIEDLGKQNAGDREAFDTGMKHMANTTDNLMKDTRTLSDVLKNSQSAAATRKSA